MPCAAGDGAPESAHAAALMHAPSSVSVFLLPCFCAFLCVPPLAAAARSGRPWGYGGRSEGGAGASATTPSRGSALAREGIVPAVQREKRGAHVSKPAPVARVERRPGVPLAAALNAAATAAGDAGQSAAGSVRGGSQAPQAGPKVCEWSHVSVGAGSFSAKAGGAGGRLEGTSACKAAALRCAPVNDASRAAVAAAAYKLIAKVRVPPAAPGSGAAHAAWVVLARSEGGSSDCVALRLDCAGRKWALELRRGAAGGRLVRAIAERADRELRPGAWHELAVRVEGGAVSVYTGPDGGAAVFDTEALPGAISEGYLALGTLKGAVQWASWQVSPLTGAGGGCDINAVVGPCARRVDALAQYTGDDPHIVAELERDILDRELGVTFDDIASLEDAKALLNEAVVLPLIIPEFFTGIREPWKGVLLYGPPGTGKTLLAKAVAGTVGLTFFNISAATLTSKWRGESEKMVRALFGLARHHSPSVVFIDEVDALASTRGTDSEHEASRRFKAELLAQMDGVASTRARGDDGEAVGNVMVLATTNAPWDLDDALRRRLEKRIHVPLPDVAAREQTLRIHLRGVALGDDVDLARLAAGCDGFSGADLKVLCRDAAMRPMRRLCAGRTPDQLRELRGGGALLEAKLAAADFAESLKHTRPSVAKADTAKFDGWAREFGSTL